MRIAVIGAGISGLGTAYLLSRAHEVDVFEQARYAGGHTRTVRRDGLALDTGFLVHNDRNYPLLRRLFGELDVATQECEMSFSVSCGCGLEYSGRRPFAQPRRLADPGFHGLLWEIGRWLRTARRSLEAFDCESWSLARYLDERRSRNGSGAISSCRSRLPSGRALRSEPRAFGVERVSRFFLERALPHIEGGTLVVRLPDGSERSFGSGPPVTIATQSRRLFRRLATRGKIGFGESYQAGEWRSDDLVRLFELLLRNAEAATERHPRLSRALALRPSVRARNGLRASRRNIAYHCDLGNDLFELFLDESMTYSCAVFERGDEPLAEAQRRKHEAIADKLDLRPGDRLLEIGCGWGSFAVHAARERGAHVTALTISAAQATLARERVAAAGLADRTEILEEDFRTHEGRYSKIASIEMIEAIGERSFPAFFAACDRLLERGGIACIQSILVPDRRYNRYRSTPDWIERYVFPGCLIPSLTALSTAMTRASRLQIHDVEEIGPHYAETLRRWRERFLARIDDVRRLGYDDRFLRTWDFYLAYCEAAFRTRSLRDAQLVLTRPFNEKLR